MRASVNTKYGPPEVVSVQNIEKPSPNDKQVLVKIHAATVNRTDCGFRSVKKFLPKKEFTFLLN